jgi:hypothetical protein
VSVIENKRTAPSLVLIHPFIDAMKNKIADAVRATRTPQVIPVHDGEEVSDVCLP